MLSRFFRKEKSNAKLQTPKSRRLRLERLEDRALLSVTPLEYDALRDANPEICLPTDRSEINIIELTELTNAALQKAADLAASTPQDDLVYVRTAEGASTIDLTEGLAVSIDAENFGSLTIAAPKETPINFSVAGLDGSALTINSGVVVLANANFVDVDANDLEGYANLVVAAEEKGGYVPINVSAFDATGADISDRDVRQMLADAKTEARLALAGGLANDNPDFCVSVDAYNSIASNNYAVLFYGGSDPNSNHERYYQNLKNLYEVLTVSYNMPKENIYVLYAGGVDSSTYISPEPDQRVVYQHYEEGVGWVEDRSETIYSDLSFAKGSPVYSATASNLHSACASVAGKMNDDSRLLFFSYDHGGGRNGAVDDYNDTLCGWEELLPGATVADALFQIDRGYVTTAHNQCYGGGILDDIQDPATGAVKDADNGATWFGFAATNHYEESVTYLHTDATTGRTYGSSGGAQLFTDAIDPLVGGKLFGTDVLDYVKSNMRNIANETYANNAGTWVEGEEHPWAVGAAFSVFNTETPSTVVTLASDVVNLTDGQISLREAIAYANSYPELGGTITFAPSLKGQTITLSGAELALSQAITLDASALWNATNDAPGVTLNADGKSHVFNVTGGTADAPVELIGLKIANGTAQFAGGVMAASGAAFSAKDCVFVGNKTTNSGGGGLCVDGWAALENCVFSGNSAASDGGAIFVASTGSLTATGLAVSNNSAGSGGGGLHVAKSGTATITNASFTGNGAAWGGGWHICGAATGDGVTLDGNKSGGIDVDSAGTLTLKNSAISNNIATGDGGGIYLGGSATLENVAITGNQAAGNGGGLRVNGTLTATGLTISGNEATDQGGGLRVNGTATLSNSTISGNSASWGGGAMVWGTLNLTNALVVENAATSGGGGFYVGGTATFRSATIAANEAGWGGGLQVSNDGTATLCNAILATNDGGDVSDGATLNAYNVLSSHTKWDAGSNNYIYNASQPLFKDAANGDYRLADNSQALNKGNDVHAVDATGAALTTDLAGNPRFAGTVDLGAYEYQQAEPLSSPSLSVSAASSLSLKVTIGKSAHASGYALEYSTSADFATKKTQTFATAGTYMLTGLSANTTYYVRVQTISDVVSYVDSAWSSVESATTSKITLTNVTLSGTPKVGEPLTASVSPSGATVSWQWYAGSDASSVTTAISGATSPTFTPTLAYVGQYLKVVATGTGDYAGSVSATVDLVPPTAPTDVKFGEYDASEKNATLTWIDAATNEIRYEARYSVDDGATWTTLANLAANATSRVCDDLNVGETYVFQIRAVAANGLASDWASAKFLVWATFGASEYVVEQNCAFYLSASDASDGAPTYYWDLSGSEVEEPSNFIERNAGFWTTVEELGFGVGEHTIRIRARDANGIFGSTVVATLRVVATQSTFDITTSSSADGSILRLNLQATTPDGSPVARWRFDWGDGQTSDFAQLSDALTAGHYYAPTAEDAVYDVSLTVVDATGAGGDVVYALTSHKVAGYGAVSQAAVETVASASTAEEALNVDAADGCDAEIIDSRATTNGTKGDAMSRMARTSTRRAGLKALSDAEIRSDSKRLERVDLTAASASAVLAEEFDELDFFIDEDELDALAKRFIRRYS